MMDVGEHCVEVQVAFAVYLPCVDDDVPGAESFWGISETSIKNILQKLNLTCQA